MIKMTEYKGSVLLIEDNVELNDANSRVLELCGYEVYIASTLEQARQKLLWVDPDVILLDVMLPDGSGFDFCEEIRGKTTAYILFLTAKASHEDMIQGMSIGGDSYITKPFHIEEMVVKVDAAMRRYKSEEYQIIKKGSFTLDITAIQAFYGGESLDLTSIEFSLLLLFIKNEGQTLNSNFIYEKVWKSLKTEDKNTLRATISRLRRKIKHTDYSIVTHRDYGYSFQKS